VEVEIAVPAGVAATRRATFVASITQKLTPILKAEGMLLMEDVCLLRKI